MLRLVADENLTNAITRGLLHRNPNLDIVRVQDVGLSGADDQSILAWPAETGRILITHDVRTMPRYADERIEAGEPMPGVFEVRRSLSTGQAIEEILMLAECSLEGEWEGKVCYLPL